jgi:HlyD family secretion protein
MGGASKMKGVASKVLVVLALGLLGCHSAVETKHGDSSNSAANGAVDVVGMGRIEPAGGLIDVGAMMGDRLGALRVKEGDRVKKGEPLADLESRTLRELEVAAAAAQLQNAEGRLEVERRLADVKTSAAKLNLKKAETAALSIDAQKKKIQLLQVGVELGQKDRERLKALSKDMVTDQERERQALLVQQTQSELESAQASLKQAVETNQLALDVAKLELTAAEDAKRQLPFIIPLESLRVARKLAETQYARSQVIAPCDGVILKTYVRPGETIGAKPILQIADVDRMVVVVEVYENEAKHLHVGQKALVTSKAFSPPHDKQGIEGRVARIGRMISVPLLRSVDPFAPADRHVVEVRVELDAASSRQSAALSNLQVDVRFQKGD